MQFSRTRSRNTRVIGVLLVVVCAMLGVWRLHKAVLGPGDLRRAHVWQCGELYLVPERGTRVAYTLETKSGEPIKGRTSVAISEDSLAYWSQEDGSVAVFQDGKELRWHALPGTRGRTTVTSIGIVGAFVVCSCVPEGKRPTVLALDTLTGKWRHIADAVDARANSISGTTIALLDSDRNVSRLDLSSGQRSPTVCRIGNAKSWDYDTASDTVFWVDEKRTVHVRRMDGHEIRLRRPLLWAPDAVSWQPDRDEVWVPVAMVWSMNGFLVYSPRGRLLGFVESGIGWYEGVWPASECTVSTLNHSGLKHEALSSWDTAMVGRDD